MAEKSKEDVLLDEILKNARNDRNRIEGRLDKLAELAKSDPELSAALGGITIGSVEALTKVNSQLVEVLKLKTKERLMAKSTEKFNESEVDAVFDEIDEEKN